MSLCKVLSMIIATIPDRKRTMTKEFMMLDRTRKWSQHQSTTSVKVWQLATQKKKKQQKTHSIPKPLNVGVRHGDEDIVPPRGPLDGIIFLLSEAKRILQVAWHMNWSLFIYPWRLCFYRCFYVVLCFYHFASQIFVNKEWLTIYTFGTRSDWMNLKKKKRSGQILLSIYCTLYFFGLESYRKCDGVGVSYGYIIIEIDRNLHRCL